MDAAVGVITALFPTEPILHKLGVILLRHGEAVSNRFNSVADATLQFPVPLAESLVAGDRDVLSTIRE
jgi:hypothetical protein